MSTGATTENNPWMALSKNDIAGASAWLTRDEKLMKRRMNQRPAVRNKPYKGAPNTVVPIIDDNVREKTDMEISMLLNARMLAHFIALDPDCPAIVVDRAQTAFDAYLRHVINAIPRLEEALEQKNARGFTTFKIFREEDDRWGQCPTFEAVDPREVFVPADTKDIQKAERATVVLRYTPREFERVATESGWDNVATIKELATSERTATVAVSDSFTTIKHLIGVEPGTEDKYVILFEVFGYADDWCVAQDVTGRVIKDRKCRIVFSATDPDKVCTVSPWREEDRAVPMGAEEQLTEIMRAEAAGEVPNFFKMEIGKDKPWPLVQSRFENRSRYYYDSRGVSQLVEDEQIYATTMRNAKMVMIDYTQLPMYSGTGTRLSTNIVHGPGGYLPQDVKTVTPPPWPEGFGNEEEAAKRNAARRTGAISQYNRSAEDNKKGGSKTATEIDFEKSRGTQVSSASVDRFNNPLGELFTQLWNDLRRMKKRIPMISGHTLEGYTDDEMYKWNFTVVPSSSAKTLDPDDQFSRDVKVSQVLMEFAKRGVPLDMQRIATDIARHWDATRSQSWILDPHQMGAGGEQPIYLELQALKQVNAAQDQTIQAMGNAIKLIAGQGGAA